DPALERARRRGIVGGNVDEFQHDGGGVAVHALRLARDAELTHAAHVFTPSAYLRDLAVSWGVEPNSVSVLPNPAPPLPELPPGEWRWSSAKARTACSSRSATRKRSPARSAATSATRSCERGFATPQPSPSPPTHRSGSSRSSRRRSCGSRVP